MQAAAPPLLKLTNVDVVYDGVIQVLRSANLEVPTGKIVVLLGANGAGKTTTLRAISGLLAIDTARSPAAASSSTGRRSPTATRRRPCAAASCRCWRAARCWAT